jgi:hypothetical protein
LFLGKYDEAETYLQESAAIAQESDAGPMAGMPITMLGQAIAMRDPDSELARQYMKEGAARMQVDGDRWMVNMAQMGMAFAAERSGDLQDARLRFTALIPLFQELGDQHRVNMVRSEIAHIDRHQGRLNEAEAAYRETILAWKRLGHRAAIAHQLESFAFIAQHRGETSRAARLYGAAEGLRESIGIQMTPLEREEYDAEIVSLRRDLDQQTFASAWAEGRGLMLEQAMALALAKPPES